jgi:hypothetical protein
MYLSIDPKNKLLTKAMSLEKLFSKQLKKLNFPTNLDAMNSPTVKNESLLTKNVSLGINS